MFFDSNVYMFRFFRKNKVESKILHQKEFVVVDTELTGLNEKEDSIISIGAILMRERSILVGDIFYRILNPQSKLKGESVLIHELTSTELEKCPDTKPILREFLDFVKNRPVVGHFIEIDLNFLKRQIKKSLNIKFEPEAIDTYIIFKWLIERGLISEKFKGAKSLSEIAEAFNIKVDSLHDSLSDAFITAQIFQREIALIQKIQLSWFDFIKKIGKPHVSGYMFGQYEKNYQF
ncbi:DNA polymerase-3 subunit epsilon [Thermodesulfovibrio aggregans]|uniref:DNA polymerase-3 subunit epsilon n=1 Tax=Thermodesulfovibrio aggregans TaxID=86166 RepID=A0A0U9HW81_9BACT|nr:DNA polymerase-3 subunit epsilon [Thermodesulfovibrio aggregans]